MQRRKPESRAELKLRALGLLEAAANFRIVMAFDKPSQAAFRSGLAEAESALRHSPHSARLHALRGKVLSCLARAREAREALSRSIELDAFQALPRAWLAEALLLENKPAAALAAAEAARKLEPDCGWASFYRAAALFAAGREKDAHAALRKLLESRAQAPVRAAAGAFASILEAKAGKSGTALALLSDVSSLCPGAPWPQEVRTAVRSFCAGLTPGSEARSVGSSTELRRREAQQLDRQGRAREAEAVLRVAARGNCDDPLVFQDLGRLLEGRGRGAEAEAAYRKACALKPARLQPYIRLAALALARGGERAMAPVLREARQAAARSAGDELYQLIDRYQLAFCLLDNEEAGRIGEAILDRTRGLGHLQGLANPLTPGYDGMPLSPALQKYSRKALRLAEKSSSARPRSPWNDFIQLQWRAQFQSGTEAEALNCRRIAAFPASRYGWMRLRGGWALLYEGRFRSAITHLRAARDFFDPPDWRSQCYIAEALLFQGNPKGAWRAFRAAVKFSGEARGEAMAWHAAGLLWGGRYAEALRVLETIPPGIPSPYASCWKGAALCKLRRFRPALDVLDEAISRFPNDWEARVWRAETLLELGRPREAAREADLVLTRGAPDNHYARAVRGLARAAVGDADGVREDFEALPPPLIESIRVRSRLDETASRYHAIVMEKVLASSRGLRRTDVPALSGASESKLRASKK